MTAFTGGHSMERQLLGKAAATALFCGAFCLATLLAQQSAHIAGTWVIDPMRAESLAQTADTSELAVRLIIEQSADDVRIDRVRRNGQSDTLTYSFDPKLSSPPAGATGSGEPNAAAASAINPDGTTATSNRVLRARAEWDSAGHLVLLSDVSINGQAMTAKQTFTPDAGGRELIVQTEIVMQHGYTGPASTTSSGKSATSGSRDVYVKAKETSRD
jgi:hypothetical protein